MNADEILDAIDRELEESTEAFKFKVKARQQRGPVWSLEVEGEEKRSALDESLEGATAWWPGPPKGAADVLAIVPENEEMHLRYATTTPPRGGETLFVYPPVYLRALRERWADESWVSTCRTWFDEILSKPTFDVADVIESHRFAWLRAKQRDAFNLPGWTAGFLWGPPGTGKTTTLGAMLAALLLQFPTKRVLLCSTTNSAVDQALIEVDKKLADLASTVAAATALRRRIFRIGNHFEASRYEGREHLIPAGDPGLMRELMRVEAERPTKTNIERYAQWKAREEAIRAKIRKESTQPIREARMAALTTTSAAYRFPDLKEFAPFDLVVFDEASQINLPYALAIAPLGRRVVFAGDPCQLSPIVQADHPTAKKWLGSSIFNHMHRSHGSTCQLVEQSRMAQEICNVVSNVFYDGVLQVAADAGRNPLWHAERTPVNVSPVRGAHVHIETIAAEGQWSANYKGPIRYQSAEWIKNFVHTLVGRYPSAHVLVLTPFRAQRSLMKTMLARAPRDRVTVSTVHRAQGTERDIVVFDPVKGDSPFLSTDEARRLVNVGISRAKNLLLVVLSRGDRTNPFLREVATVIEAQVFRGEYTPFSNFAHSQDFPRCTIGARVRAGDCCGVVESLTTDGKTVIIADAKNGHHRKFRIDSLVPAWRRPRSVSAGFDILETPLEEYEGLTRGHGPRRKRLQQTPPRTKKTAPLSGLGRQTTQPRDIADYVNAPNFPMNALGKYVKIGTKTGKVTAVRNGGALFYVVQDNRRKIEFRTRDIVAVHRR